MQRLAARGVLARGGLLLQEQRPLFRRGYHEKVLDHYENPR